MKVQLKNSFSQPNTDGGKRGGGPIQSYEREGRNQTAQSRLRLPGAGLQPSAARPAGIAAMNNRCGIFWRMQKYFFSRKANLFRPRGLRGSDFREVRTPENRLEQEFRSYLRSFIRKFSSKKEWRKISLHRRVTFTQIRFQCSFSCCLKLEVERRLAAWPETRETNDCPLACCCCCCRCSWCGASSTAGALQRDFFPPHTPLSFFHFIMTLSVVKCTRARWLRMHRGGSEAPKTLFTFFGSRQLGGWQVGRSGRWAARRNKTKTSAAVLAP